MFVVNGKEMTLDHAILAGRKKAKCHRINVKVLNVAIHYFNCNVAQEEERKRIEQGNYFPTCLTF